MNLWNFLKQNNNDIPQIDAIILDDPSRSELTQELKQRAANNDVKDRSNRFTNLFNKIADIDNINEPIETPSIKIGNFYNDKISPMKEKFISGLFGKLVNPSIENENNVEYDNYGNTQLNTAIGTPRRTGGFFNDFANGAKENYNNGFQISNLLNDFGKNKGVGYRLGEGLGTIGRIAQSPLGRAAITAGLVGLTGGSALQALTFGGMAGAGNQYNILRDKMYRNELSNQGIDTSNLKGYVNDNTFNKVLEAKRLQDNAEFKRMYYEAQQKNHEDMVNLQRAKMLADKQQQAIDNYYKKLGYDLKKRGLDIQDKKIDETLKAKQNADDLGDIQKQLDNFANTFETVNNPYRYRLAGGLSEKMNMLSNDEANFNAQRTLLFNQIARKLGGEKGVLSDKDIERVDAALPKLSDTLEQKRAKMKAVYALLDIKQGSNANYVQGLNDNPLGLDL